MKFGRQTFDQYNEAGQITRCVRNATQYVTLSVNNTIRPYFSAKFNFLVNANTIILRNVLNVIAKYNKTCKDRNESLMLSTRTITRSMSSRFFSFRKERSHCSGSESPRLETIQRNIFVSRHDDSWAARK